MKIYVEDNFLSEYELSKCLELYSLIENNSDWHDGGGIEFWDNRVFDISNILSIYQDREHLSILIKILKRMRTQIVDKFELDKKIHPDTMQLVKWSSGIEQEPHADNCNEDGSDNHSPWREYSGVIYLNNDYIGGETYFPNFNYEVSPEPGRLVIFKGDLEHLHGVKKIKEGERKTIITFWSGVMVNEYLRLG